MLPPDSDAPFDLTPERLERVIEVVALASAGAFAEAVAHATVVAEDELGVLEHSMIVFIAELQATRAQNEQAMAALQEAKQEIEQKLTTIERQQVAIREMATPIIDVWDGILTVPLTGVVDQLRALDITEKLLRRIVASRARWVLVDLTGVEEVDAPVAGRLIDLARAIKLVGAGCVLTGIQPAIAEALTDLDVSLGGLVALPTLRDGLRHCLRARS